MYRGIFPLYLDESAVSLLYLKDDGNGQVRIVRKKPTVHRPTPVAGDVDANNSEIKPTIVEWLIGWTAIDCKLPKHSTENGEEK